MGPAGGRAGIGLRCGDPGGASCLSGCSSRSPQLIATSPARETGMAPLSQLFPAETGLTVPVLVLVDTRHSAARHGKRSLQLQQRLLPHSQHPLALPTHGNGPGMHGVPGGLGCRRYPGVLRSAGAPRIPEVRRGRGYPEAQGAQGMWGSWGA